MIVSADTGTAGLPSVLAHWASVTPDAPFLTFDDVAPRRWTWREFAADVAGAAAVLARLGVGPGERVVVHTGNSRGAMVAIWAALQTGATAVPTISLYAQDELAFVLSDCAPTAIVTTAELRATVEAAAEGVGADILEEDDLLGRAGADGLSVPVATDPDAPAIVLYTSGTTSRPKGVMLGHRGLLFTAGTFADHLRLQPADVTLVFMPLFHINGLVFQMLAAMLAGSGLVLTPRFSVRRYWELISEHRVTVSHSVAGPVRLLIEAAPTPAERDHSLRLMSYGMPLDDAELRSAEDRFGVPLIMIWGATETCCGGTLTPIDYAYRSGYQVLGRALRGWEVAVVNPERDGHETVPDGVEGELVVRSPGIMLGYLGRPDATAETIRDGWIHTGDIGMRDADGFFHFTDRMKDMIKPSGENVAAGEVERVLMEHPGVAMCAVVGLPDRVRMERVAAVVVRAQGAALQEPEIVAWCAERLARFKVPTSVEFRDELPLTSIGKVRKSEVRQSLIDDLSGG